ncbi:MAG: hypothetical protein QOI35_1865 [Cryptosporangiaceae bacterium]|nr:hypothetical protein [Cryptosporangiaceae bacterium]
MRKRLRHLPPALAASAVTLVVFAVAAFLLDGLASAAGVAVGVVIVAFSFVASSLVLAWADIVDRNLILPAGLVTYVLKFALFGVVLYAVGQSGWRGSGGIGAGLIAGTLVWATTQAVWVYRSRIPYVDLTES